MTDFLLTLGLGLLAIGAGTSFVVQQVVNANLRAELGSAFWAGFVSYLGGTLAMLVAIVVTRDGWLSLAKISSSSWFSWTGGLFGAIYIAISILLLPRMGAAMVVALIVVGQMLTSVAFDHFAIMGAPLHPLSLPRAAGACFLILGVILVRY